MHTRDRRVIIWYFIVSAVGITIYTLLAIHYENTHWFTEHDAWQDVRFLTGGDAYAYTTFYAPALEQNGNDDRTLGVYISGNEARVTYSHLSAIRIGDTTYHRGDTLKGILSGEVVNVTLLGSGGEIIDERPARFYFASGIPTMYVQIRTGDIDQITYDKSVEGTIIYELVDTDGSVDSASTAVITARGNNNNSVDKKSYNITLDDAASLLDMQAASKWALRATALDHTMLMDKIALDTSKSLGIPYAMDCEHINLYIDGEYEGVYLLTQRPKTNGGSVDVDDGYLMEFDFYERYQDAEQGFQTEHRNVIVHSPKSLETDELDTLAAYVEEAEEAVYNAAGVNPTTGKTWFEYLDAASWIKTFWVQEFFVNADADYTSEFLTKLDGDPLLYSGPCWDYDKAYWISYYNDKYQSNILTIAGRLTKSWLQELDNKADFRAARIQYYLDSFHYVIEQIEEHELPELVERITPSLVMMYDRYGEDALDQSYIDGIEQTFTAWIDARLLFYDDYMSHPDEYAVVYLDVSENNERTTVFAFRKGTALDLSMGVYGHKEWAYKDGGTFTNGDIINNDVTLIPLDYADGESYEYFLSSD